MHSKRGKSYDCFEERTHTQTANEDETEEDGHNDALTLGPFACAN